MKDTSTELLIELLQGALEEEGYKTKRFSDSKMHLTSAYDAIEIKGYNGYFTILVEQRKEYIHPKNNSICRADEVFNSI